MNPNLRDVLLTVAKRRQQPIWLVGGPVRDSLLGVPCKDWDFVCRQARPWAVQIAKALHAKFIVLDEENRIYRVVLPGGENLDFAELQGRSIQEDLGRRDFTINAMAVPLTRATPSLSQGERAPAGWVRGILDPFGGQKDLKRKVIRSVYERVFPDDPLRVLRAFRFAVQCGFSIETRTLSWIKKHREGLEKVSAERIREELIRFWKHSGTASALRLMDKSGVLRVLFPEMEACRRTAVSYYGKGGVLRHSIDTVENLEWILGRIQSGQTAEYLRVQVGGFPRLAWLKWAAFLHDIGKPATAKMMKGRLRFFEHEHVGAGIAMTVGRRLRLSRQEVHLFGLWVRNHMRTGSLAAAPRITEKALSRFFRDLGEDGVGMVLLSLADHYTYLKRTLWDKGKDPVDKMGRRLLNAYFHERAKLLPERVIDGHQLMKALRLKPGPLIGKLLDAVQDAQAEGKVSTIEEAVEVARKSLKRQEVKR